MSTRQATALVVVFSAVVVLGLFVAALALWLILNANNPQNNPTTAGDATPTLTTPAPTTTKPSTLPSTTPSTTKPATPTPTPTVSTQTPTTTATARPTVSRSVPVEQGRVGRLGQVMTVAGFQLSVERVADGPRWLGHDSGDEDEERRLLPKGRFVVVSFDVFNDSERTRRFLETDAWLVDAAGQRVRPDVRAGWVASGGKKWRKRVEPQDRVAGEWYFDVPKGFVVERVVVASKWMPHPVVVQVR